jgi:hypothetical protein
LLVGTGKGFPVGFWEEIGGLLGGVVFGGWVCSSLSGPIVGSLVVGATLVGLEVVGAGVGFSVIIGACVIGSFVAGIGVVGVFWTDPAASTVTVGAFVVGVVGVFWPDPAASTVNVGAFVVGVVGVFCTDPEASTVNVGASVVTLAIVGVFVVGLRRLVGFEVAGAELGAVTGWAALGAAVGFSIRGGREIGLAVVGILLGLPELTVGLNAGLSLDNSTEFTK